MPERRFPTKTKVIEIASCIVLCIYKRGDTEDSAACLGGRSHSLELRHRKCAGHFKKHTKLQARSHFEFRAVPAFKVSSYAIHLGASPVCVYQCFVTSLNLDLAGCSLYRVSQRVQLTFALPLSFSALLTPQKLKTKREEEKR
ncbi:hypothetical protein H112_03900 [Trichophyton rubrum D6]|uniref:Uncharacterized protein n=3 Tax=Trichophyton TaxID=5550 RepID=A0A080WJY4_TRIRC|nr:uncharacterized protein TERG_12250 [Trichophyton rubrum CBS 118892]EZF23454.1 hypothetical protein H100_03908 [Trichophyton rubrum MR850]EZF42612.1 hypothetical protein H102_03895 [Trichophyton rubrum CBS 100081]EZF53228.1 hypothetical protein H103_03909 [Trichophyton rubrum CBS 288.86]EZF63711.1 hypothetical protein H104_03894 [Trichophyton rubrum CBS 289.86]EZF74216.1 hypothetical protein H105_03922 [Trichophyton soudanense CBS 452.61]EZF85176.1 hypothetical protein H110_03901 [Trichophy